RGTTAYNARTIMELTTSPLKFAKVAPPKPKRGRGTIGKAEAAVVNAVGKVEAIAGTVAHAAAIASTQIDVLMEHDPNTNKPTTTQNFFATYGGLAGGHYEGMKEYLANLIDTSRNLS